MDPMKLHHLRYEYETIFERLNEPLPPKVRWRLSKRLKDILHETKEMLREPSEGEAA